MISQDDIEAFKEAFKREEQRKREREDEAKASLGKEARTPTDFAKTLRTAKQLLAIYKFMK